MGARSAVKSDLVQHAMSLVWLLIWCTRLWIFLAPDLVHQVGRKAIWFTRLWICPVLCALQLKKPPHERHICTSAMIWVGQYTTYTLPYCLYTCPCFLVHLHIFLYISVSSFTCLCLSWPDPYTLYLHCIWRCILWFSCQNYHMPKHRTFYLVLANPK